MILLRKFAGNGCFDCSPCDKRRRCLDCIQEIGLFGRLRGSGSRCGEHENAELRWGRRHEGGATQDAMAGGLSFVSLAQSVSYFTNKLCFQAVFLEVVGVARGILDTLQDGLAVHKSFANVLNAAVTPPPYGTRYAAKHS